MQKFPLKKAPSTASSEVAALKLHGLSSELNDRASPENAAIVRNTFLGAAALGITILVALTQVGAKDLSVKIAVLGAAFSVPIWLCLAGSLELFLHLGDDFFQEYRKLQTSKLYRNLQFFAGAALYVAICGLVYFLMPVALLVFLVSSLVGVVYLSKVYLRVASAMPQAQPPSS